MQTEVLRLDQAPPLSIPLSFFLTAPLAVATAGGLLLWNGSLLFLSHWLPLTLGLTHLCTLGFLTMVMMGALYQMTPVVAGSPVARIRLGHAVYVLWVSGVIALCCGLALVRPDIVYWAIAVLTLALLLFVIPLGMALIKAPSFDETVLGMGIAVAALLVAGIFGLWMAHGYGGMQFPGPRPLWLQVHLSVALLGWVGGLITAVSWQVIPMFYLAEPLSPAVKRTTQGLLVIGVLTPALVLTADYFALLGDDSRQSARIAALGTLPALISVWGLHPITSFASLLKRRRRRIDGSLLFWRAGLLLAPPIGVVAVCAYLLSAQYWGLLLGWLALWGWAGMIIHGMLTRIVPFLVWFHRFASLVGEVPVPSVRGLLPDGWTRLGFGLHGASVVVGVVGIASGSGLLIRLTGLLVLATAANLGRSLIHVVRQRPQ
jgi:hypothetical protein